MMTNYYAYTVVLEKDSSGFWMAAFPDLEGCATNAKTLEEAIIQAGGVSQRVVVAMSGARKRWEDRSVNRMVTLPAWLDEKGREANLNFSQLLQAAVTKELRL